VLFGDPDVRLDVLDHLEFSLRRLVPRLAEHG